MYKVLIVDDEPAILEGLKKIIDWEEYGLEIAAEAKSGEDALSLIKSNDMDLMITDIRMQDINGLELIRHAKNLGLRMKYVVLSGYDDFNYVKEAVKLGIENYLLKPVNRDELSATLSSIIDKLQNEKLQSISHLEERNILKNNILYRWVTNNISLSELQQRSQLFDFDFASDKFRVCILKILRSSVAKNDNMDYVSSELTMKALDICNGAIAGKNNAVIFNDIYGDIIFIFNGSLTDMEVTRALLSKCISNINSLLKINVFATIGCLENNLEKVHNSYTRAKNLLEYSFLLTSNSIISSEDIQKFIYASHDKIELNLDSLKLMMSSGKANEVHQFIGSIFQKLKNMSGITPLLIQNITSEILFHIYFNVKIVKGKAEGLMEPFICSITEICNNRTLDEIKDYLIRIADHAMRFIEKEEPPANPYSKKILAYIDNNYDKGICLKSLSAEFNLSAAYLGQLLKKETGKLFSDYLNDIRIKKAQELLIKTNLKTNEVSEKVGYTDPSYFYRTFKKITGVSPSEYRSLMS